MTKPKWERGVTAHTGLYDLDVEKASNHWLWTVSNDDRVFVSGVAFTRKSAQAMSEVAARMHARLLRGRPRRMSAAKKVWT